MIKKFFFLVAIILMGNMTVVNAKINYVPLYIVDTTPDVKGVKHAPTTPLIITQDDHRLTLPEIDDSLTFKVFKDDDCIYEVAYENLQQIVNLPSMLVGDYEVRLCADTYYCYGYLTLERQNSANVPEETEDWEKITLWGSDTSLEYILDKIMGLNVVEYNVKRKDFPEDYDYIDEKSKEWARQQWEKEQAEITGERRIGLLLDELRDAFPQLVDANYGINIGGLNLVAFFPVLISCIQELKIELDNRTEKIVDVMMSRSMDPSAVREVRAAIGNTLLSTAPSSVYESALVRYILTDDVTNAYISITDMEGRLITRVPVSSSETSVSIDSGTLGQGVFLCTLFVNGENVGTKRLVKTR